MTYNQLDVDILVARAAKPAIHPSCSIWDFGLAPVIALRTPFAVGEQPAMFQTVNR